MSRSDVIQQTLPWQKVLSQAIASPAELLQQLQLPQSLLADANISSELFALRVPEPFLRRIRPGDPNDPLLLQVLPLQAEQQKISGYVTDPLQEADANHRDGLIHKYNGRVLLILTGACAINCRYCFRRHFPYQDNRLGPEQWQSVLDYIEADQGISEVIFSGGDPLAVPDSRLRKMIADLEQIPHLRRLRIHTRLPVMIPQRVTPELLDILQNSRLKTVMVLHSNHANEIDDEVREAIRLLRRADVQMLNQAVLLRGINNSVAVLKTLSESLFDAGVLPYYLFVFDPVEGAAHFDISDADAQRLMSQLQGELPGYLVPKLAREIPGRNAKTLLPVDSQPL
ncbi:EF-P beta-lysylation protein EpmB [Marinobacterium jannaschii]|uniref:EF-P beta-lysylation protein EpmB n=1 Tax=Marinobacterium jannaschii TaxID=64970 RepID=UPI00047F266D|nr:EF-P beta-lysylation protein EpmB [Marinobacterium jannaschii]